MKYILKNWFIVIINYFIFQNLKRDFVWGKGCGKLSERGLLFLIQNLLVPEKINTFDKKGLPNHKNNVQNFVFNHHILLSHQLNLRLHIHFPPHNCNVSI